MQTFLTWIEHRKSTYRWLGFLAWLAVGRLEPLPIPHTPSQQWPRLPLVPIRQAAEAVGPWLLTVLTERQQRALGWNEATDAPLLAADLALQPFGADDASTRPSWRLWHVQQEFARLVRLVEAPERLLPRGEGLPCEARYRALAVGLRRLQQVYTALEAGQAPEEAAVQWCAAAARARQRATLGTTAAA